MYQYRHRCVLYEPLKELLYQLNTRSDTNRLHSSLCFKIKDSRVSNFVPCQSLCPTPFLERTRIHKHSYPTSSHPTLNHHLTITKVLFPFLLFRVRMDKETCPIIGMKIRRPSKHTNTPSYSDCKCILNLCLSSRLKETTTTIEPNTTKIRPSSGPVSRP